jgi:hypothetical protein
MPERDRTLTERTLQSRLAAHTRWSRCADPATATEPARRALLDKFERQVDPDGVLSPADRSRRAEHARKAYFTGLALKSARSRRKGRELLATADAAEAELSGDAA